MHYNKAKDKYTGTVSCKKTDYVWNLEDTTFLAHQKTVMGHKYYIWDVVNTQFNRKTYYEGYLPSDWKAQALAIWFHNEMFSYSAFTVKGWS